MIEICHHCGQVLPETEIEKQLAACKAENAKIQIRMAELSFQTFSDAHPCPDFMARNINAMFAAWVLLSCVVLFPVTAWLLGNGIIPKDAILWALCILGVIAYGVAHIIYIRPTTILDAHRLVVRRDFVQQYPTAAKVLGIH